MSHTPATRSYEIEFCIMEHGLMGTHQDLEHLEKSIIRKVRLQNAERRRMMRREQFGMNEDGQNRSRFPGGYGQRQIVMLNHSGNDKRKSFPGIAICAERLATYVLEAVQQSVREHQLMAAQQERANNPFAAPKDHPLRELDLGKGGKGCREENDNSCSLVKPPFPNSPLCVDPRSFSNRPQWKLVFHVIGYSLGGLVIRAALPSIIQGIEERYVKDSEESFYAVEWRSFFSLCCPNVGSDPNHPMMNSSYRLAGCLSCFCLLPEVIEDLLLKTDYIENILLSPFYLKAIKRFSKRIFITLTNDRMVWNYSAGFYLPPIERRLLDGWKPKEPILNPRAIPCRVHGGRTAERRENTPWLLYDDEELCMIQRQQDFLQSMNINPAASTEELLQNGVVIQQHSTKVGPSLERGRRSTEAISDSYSSSVSMDTDSLACWITEHSWPKKYLPKEREMAKALLEVVGPVELHVANMDKMITNYLDDTVALCGPQSCPDPKLVWGLMETTLKGAHQLVLFSGENQREARHRKTPDRRRSSCPTNSSVREDEQADEEEEEDYVSERLQSPFSFIVEFIVHRIVFWIRTEEEYPVSPLNGSARAHNTTSHNSRVRGTVADAMRSAGNSFTRPPFAEASLSGGFPNSHNNPNSSNTRGDVHIKEEVQDLDRSVNAIQDPETMKPNPVGACSPKFQTPISPKRTPSSPSRPQLPRQHRLSGEDTRRMTLEERIFPSLSTETDFAGQASRDGIPSGSSRGDLGPGEEQFLPEHGEGSFSSPLPLPRSSCAPGLAVGGPPVSGVGGRGQGILELQEETPPSSFSSSLISSRAGTDWTAAETEHPAPPSQDQQHPDFQ